MIKKRMPPGPSFKGMAEFMDKYKKDFDYENYAAFIQFVPEWRIWRFIQGKEGQKQRDRIRAQAMAPYIRALYTPD